MFTGRIQEELEIPHKRQLSQLESDVEQYREAFFNIRREHEKLKTEYEQFTVDQGRREEMLY